LLLCTENLTPFLSLLPSKGLSGLSSLLAQPNTVFAWGFKTEGIEVIMPTHGQPGRWRGWWEGVVDLIPEKGSGKRDFSLQRLFGRDVPRPFPEAEESVLRLVMPEQTGLRMDKAPGDTELRWIDGRNRQLVSWNLQEESWTGADIHFWWDGEETFHYRASVDLHDCSSAALMSARTFPKPPVRVFRTVSAPHAGDGTFAIRVENSGNDTTSAVYSEIWPWWVKGWLHQMTIEEDGFGRRGESVSSGRPMGDDKSISSSREANWRGKTWARLRRASHGEDVDLCI
jgi:phosphatidylinositol glycan class T